MDIIENESGGFLANDWTVNQLHINESFENEEIWQLRVHAKRAVYFCNEYIHMGYQMPQFDICCIIG